MAKFGKLVAAGAVIGAAAAAYVAYKKRCEALEEILEDEFDDECEETEEQAEDEERSYTSIPLDEEDVAAEEPVAEEAPAEEAAETTDAE